MLATTAELRRCSAATTCAASCNRVHHEKFLSAFGLTEETHPFMALDLTDWEAPFRAGESLQRSAGGDAWGG